MAEQEYVELLLRPHIARYLAIKLDKLTAKHTPHAEAITAELARVMVQSQELYEVAGSRPRASGLVRLGLRMRPGCAQLSNAGHKQLDDYLDLHYNMEFTRWVDQHYYAGLYATKADAIIAFRNLYGIDEGLLPLETSVRAYARYEARMKRPRKRGGHRRNSRLVQKT